MLQHAESLGYRQTKARLSKLDSFLPVIHEILIGDRKVNGNTGPRKRPHFLTAVGMHAQRIDVAGP